MDVDRRSLLTGIGSLGLTGVLGQDRKPPTTGSTDSSVASRWHPLTRSLLDRGRLAGDRPDRLRVERAVRELADAQGRAARPVIKWMESPTDVFDHLSRHGLDALLRMGTARFWRDLQFPAVFDEEVLERSFDLRCLAAQIFRVDYWDQALMAPKLSAKSDAVARNASSDAIFRARAVVAQIGWLETSLPAAAVVALCNVEMVLASGYSDRSNLIHHQLLLFRAWESGLLATWETPDALVCLAGDAALGGNGRYLKSYSDDP